MFTELLGGINSRTTLTASVGEAPQKTHGQHCVGVLIGITDAVEKGTGARIPRRKNDKEDDVDTCVGVLVEIAEAVGMEEDAEFFGKEKDEQCKIDKRKTRRHRWTTALGDMQ